jgi:hypothetical protein
MARPGEARSPGAGEVKAPKSLTIKVDKVEQILGNIEALTKQRVMVGIPQEKNAERDDGTITNAEIGYINEFGEPEMNIPARPHLVPGIREAIPKIVPVMRKGAVAAMDGSAAAADALTAVGLIGQVAVQKKITDGPFQALSERTIYNRQHRRIAPRMGTKPLIDTGAYRQAITFVIRKLTGR